MKKMIELKSEEGRRIEAEVDEQVLAELGLMGVSRHNMTNEDFCRYWEVLKCRLEHAGINVARYECQYQTHH